jgi:hypothetical protein
MLFEGIYPTVTVRKEVDCRESAPSRKAAKDHLQALKSLWHWGLVESSAESPLSIVPIVLTMMTARLARRRVLGRRRRGACVSMSSKEPSIVSRNYPGLVVVLAKGDAR